MVFFVFTSNTTLVFWIQLIVPILLLTFIFLFINFLVVHSIKRRAELRLQLRAQPTTIAVNNGTAPQRDRKLLIFTIVMSVMILIGNICHLLSVITPFVVVLRATTYGAHIFILTNTTLLFLIQSATSFVYYQFNSQFNTAFKKLFLNCFVQQSRLGENRTPHPTRYAVTRYTVNHETVIIS